MASDLLEQISKLRGSINTYKSDPKEITSNEPYSANPARGRGAYRGRGYSTTRGHRGRGRGRGRGAWVGPVRNRTLIVNNDQSKNSDYISTISPNGYKLINKAVYEKDLHSQALTKEQKAASLMEAKAKILRKKLELRISKNKVKLDLCDRCLIGGHLYAVSRYGARLVLLDIPKPGIEKKVHWNGYDYTRGKNGNLRLEGQKVFLKEQCRYFQKSGECKRGDKCKYTHNASKVSVCRKYIKGQCTDENCHLSHELNEFNTPICHFFAKGSCKNPDCLFLHVNPELELICRPFAIGNYCFRGKNCKFIHSFECPDNQLTKECPRGKGCKLVHSNKDNLDARLTFTTLSPEYFQLPDLTRLDDISSDPRIQKNDIEDNEDNHHISDDEDDDFDIDLDFINNNNGFEQLEVSADFIHF